MCIRDRIFEKGYTGCNGRADKRSTGIGLYLCRQIMEKLSHTIRIESEMGVGTKVYLGLDTVSLLIVLYLFAYVLIVIAASVMTQVLMIQRYYKNLFTDEGYLTNVLPVSATNHILSKMLVFGAWSILNALSVLASFAFLLLPSAIRYFTANTCLLYTSRCV